MPIGAPEGIVLHTRMAGSSSAATGDIEDQYNLYMNSIKMKLEQVSPAHTDCCIYRVPQMLRKLNENAYTPQIISIGPFHHGKQNLQSMEKHKWRYMDDLLHRASSSEEARDACGKAIWGLEKTASNCYAETTDLNRNNFVEIMLFDGCFVLELFIKHSEKRDEYDPLLDNFLMFSTIMRDMVLLENQIPFIVLESLYDVLVGRMSKPLSAPLLKLVSSIFEPILHMKQEVSNLSYKHLLDLLRNFYLPAHPTTTENGGNGPRFVYCATELRKAGINYKKRKSNNLTGLKFSPSNGVLEIPPLSIFDGTESLFRNLIAFEQCSDGTISYDIASYAIFMDYLINSSNDVELLQRKKIIENYLGREEDVSNLFNNLCKEVAVGNFTFSGLCKDLDGYYNSPWHRRKAKLVRDYFHSPWAILSLIAAILLLIFTFLQTVFSILSYFPH